MKQGTVRLTARFFTALRDILIFEEIVNQERCVQSRKYLQFLQNTNGESQVFVFDSTETSGAIIEGSTGEAGINLEPHYAEQITETFERSRGLLNGGFEFRFKLPSYLGGFELNFERKPRTETKTMKKAIYKPKQTK